MSLNRRILYAFFLFILIIAAGSGGWMYRDRIFADTPAEDIRPNLTTDNINMADKEVKKEKSPLYIDEQKSISTLFSLFYSTAGNENHDFEESYLDLVSYNIAPEYYIVLKKPFRVSISDPDNAGSYLVIRNTDEKGATIIDADGAEQVVDRDFILNNWGERVSWVYPMPRKTATIFQGSGAPEVLDIQDILNDMGYMVKTTGIYDQSTFQEIMKFQEDFGLQVDGIAGPRTRALLYQMAR